MQIHNLKRNTPQKKARLVGRGGRRGKTSGRGTKGQKARAGRKMRPEIRDVIKRLPKLRGYFFKGYKAGYAPLSLAALESNFKAGETVSPQTLVDKGVLTMERGSLPKVKILSTGELTLKLVVEGCAVSAGAKAQIEKAGGSVTMK